MSVIYNMERYERLKAAKAFVGQHVTIGKKSQFLKPVVGEVIAVATASPSDILVIQEDHPNPDKHFIYPTAILLAAIRTIEPT